MLKREQKGITQKSLTQTLRRLQRNGIITRRIITTPPIAVEYEITSLGRTIEEPIDALCAWTRDYLPPVEAARQAFDEGEVSNNFSLDPHGHDVY